MQTKCFISLETSHSLDSRMSISAKKPSIFTRYTINQNKHFNRWWKNQTKSKSETWTNTVPLIHGIKR